MKFMNVRWWSSALFYGFSDGLHSCGAYRRALLSMKHFPKLFRSSSKHFLFLCVYGLGACV
jgi:hypothetical protein